MFYEEDVKNYERKNNNGIAYGSEGCVYKYKEYAVKLFKKVNGEKFMKQKEEKTNALKNLDLDGFIKPEIMVYDKEGNFSGYAMKYVDNKGDVADLCHINGDKYTLDQKICYLLKVEELIKKAHEAGVVLNDVAIWNFLVTDNNDVIGIDTDNFEFDKYKSDTDVDFYLPYYQGLCKTEGKNENSDKFSFALFAMSTLFERPLSNESLKQYNPNYNYLDNCFKNLDIPEDARDELYDLISNNPEKKWIGDTLKKFSNNSDTYLSSVNPNLKKYYKML